MTLKQGQEINKKFSILNDSISNLKNSHNEYMIENGRRLQMMYNSYHQELNNHKITKLKADSIKTLYLANKKIYEHREKDFRSERINQQILTMLVMVITVILAAK
jgi:hypothetical protein